MVEILKKKLNMSFDEAVQHVEQIVQEEGFTVLLTKSIDEIFAKKLGITDYPMYTMVLGCGPKFAKAALDVSFDVGLLFPCSFVIYEEADEVFVSHSSIMKMAAELGFASIEEMQPVIEMTGEAVHRAWSRF
ncbi:MAG: DUF302 domain-containing protein [Candidatus Hermodarchaeota archaeon]|nr:DUF302 domain-containing protein [Candidatus Hermodarchaeota archaeon]